MNSIVGRGRCRPGSAGPTSAFSVLESVAFALGLQDVAAVGQSVGGLAPVKRSLPSTSVQYSRMGEHNAPEEFVFPTTASIPKIAVAGAAGADLAGVNNVSNLKEESHV